MTHDKCLFICHQTSSTQSWGRVPVDTLPRPCTCVQGPEKSTPQVMSWPQRVSQQVQLWEDDCLLHDVTCGTRTTSTTGASNTLSKNWEISSVDETKEAQQDIDHLVQQQLRNLHGQRDQVDQPLRRDREGDNLGHRTPCRKRTRDHGNLPLHRDRENLHDLQNRDINHCVKQLGNPDGESLGTTMLMNCSCGRHLSLHTTGNDLEENCTTCIPGDIDHLIQKLQLRNLLWSTRPWG